MPNKDRVVPGCADETAAWLDSHGVTYRGPVRIPLDRINKRESRNNQARREAIDPETVERYAMARRRGEVLPPIVVRVAGGGKVTIVSGNHREAGEAKAGGTEIMAYVLAGDTPTEMIALLTVEANARHGKAVDASWRHEEVSMLSGLGFSQEQIAAATASTEAWVQDSLRLRRTDNRALDLKVRGWMELTPTARRELSKLHSDPVFVEASRLVVDTEMGSGAPLRELIAQLRALRSDQEQLDLVHRVYQARVAERKLKADTGRSRLPSYRTSVGTAIGKVLAIDPGRIPGHYTTPTEMAELRRRCEDAASRLFEVIEVLDRRTEELSA